MYRSHSYVLAIKCGGSLNKLFRTLIFFVSGQINFVDFEFSDFHGLPTIDLSLILSMGIFNTKYFVEEVGKRCPVWDVTMRPLL